MYFLSRFNNPYSRIIYIAIAIILLLSFSYSSWSTGIIAILLSTLLIAVGINFLPRSKIDAPYLIMSLTTGLSMMLLLCTISFYVFHNSVGGSIIMIILSIVGFVRLYNLRCNVIIENQGHLTLLISLSLLIFFYIFCNVFYQEGHIFTDRYHDWMVHLDIGYNIRSRGLPIMDKVIFHFGLPTIIAAISEIFRINIYKASIIIALISIILLPLITWHLISGFKLPNRIRIFASITPLLWGGLYLPYDILRLLNDPTAMNLVYIFDPLFNYPPYDVDKARLQLSGTLYHNLTQLLSVTLIASFLLTYNAFVIHKKKSLFLVSCLLLGASSLVKPSGVIIFGPALFITLFINKKEYHNFIPLLITLFIFLIIYFLPNIISTPHIAPHDWNFLSSHEWHFLPKRLLDINLLYKILLALGVTIIPLVMILTTLLLSLLRKESATHPLWQQIVAISLMGGILFFILFVETTRAITGNNAWPISGALILFSPLIIFIPSI